MEARLTVDAADRRGRRRDDDPQRHRIVSARVRPGHDVRVVDISAAGVLLEGGYRLMPGSCVELHLQREGRTPEVVRGRVVRCSVAKLGASAIAYRGAVAFDRHLSWFSREAAAEYPVPPAEHRPGAPSWADLTRHVV